MISIQLFLCLVLAFSGSVNAGSCLNKAQSHSAFLQAFDKCAAEGLDNACVTKCAFQRLGMVAYGKLQYAQILQALKTETANDVFKKLEVSVVKCEEEAKQQQGCMEATAFYSCLQQDDYKATC